MSTLKTGHRQSSHLDLPVSSAEKQPPVAAVFLILFDVKAGYTIAWNRSISGLELDESVEFKSLPSGLHHVEEDIIYFTHGEDYAGISAFINRPAEESDRNAVMLAVGALVPLSYGRMGKSWRHAPELIALTKTLAQDPTQTGVLEQFWDEHRLREEDTGSSSSRTESPSVNKRRERQSGEYSGQIRSRNRATSTGSALGPPEQSLSPHHPALSLPTFLDTFGPLVFPIYKAALLRQRILIVGPAPVELACNFVYDISIISGIPSLLTSLLPLEPLPTRLHPLFSVGVHDLALLEPSSPVSENGWIACTTDDIIATKTDLYDTLITLPPSFSAAAKQKVWPSLRSDSTSPDIKATQRDLRRYRTFRRELRSYTSSNAARTPLPRASDEPTDADADDAALPQTPKQTARSSNDDAEAALAEPQSWSALAYDSFIWWASAGEKRTDLDEEEDSDASLLLPRHDHTHHSSHNGIHSPHPRHTTTSPSAQTSMTVEPDEHPSSGSSHRGLEMTIIAYFHRLTIVILRVLADAVDAADDDADVDATAVQGHAPSEDEDGIEDEAVRHRRAGTSPRQHPSDDHRADAAADDDDAVVLIEAEDMTRMGLDVRSEQDRSFVRGLVALYWGRRCTVRGGAVECCGVRIC